MSEIRPAAQGTLLGERFDRALLLAADLHRRQLRKGTTVPYLAHLLAVAALVLEQGGDEDEAIAALLHDSVEDQGGPPTLELVTATFGDHVGHLVADCTDADRVPKPPWRERKEQYLEHLALDTTSAGALRISLADKLHNLRAVVRDHRRHGADIWARFNAGPDDQLWYYRSVADVFDRRIGGVWAEELTALVDELADLVRADTA